MPISQQLYLFLVPLLLSMSYFSISLSNGRASGELKRGTPMKASVLFAATAFILLMAGNFAASVLERRIEDGGERTVLILFLLIGVRMLYHSWKKKASYKVFDINQTPVILALSFAMGMNILFAGVALQFLHLPPLPFAAILSVMIWILSFSGLLYGMQFKESFGRKMEFIAGILLILAGLWFFQAAPALS